MQVSNKQQWFLPYKASNGNVKCGGLACSSCFSWPALYVLVWRVVAPLSCSIKVHVEVWDTGVLWARKWLALLTLSPKGKHEGRACWICDMSCCSYPGARERARNNTQASSPSDTCPTLYQSRFFCLYGACCSFSCSSPCIHLAVFSVLVLSHP